MEILKNEEDVRSKVVMPWLQSLGFDESELSLEFNFSIRLGRNVFNVGRATRERAGGRADVLVQRHGQNLFVVEVKAPGTPLDDDARDQGVSYARLIHPQAPYVVLTNGKCWRFFDTITKVELGTSPTSESRFECTVDFEARNEALSYFYGFSQANILQFLKGLTDYEFQSLRAGKYKKEFYVSRRSADQTLRNFIESESHVLLVSARSGMGKSSWICNSVEALNIPCVYLTAPNIKNGVFSHICGEASWVFSPQTNTPTTFKKLVRAIEEKCLVIFLDDIDLIPFGEARVMLDEFIRETKHLTNTPKLVLGGSAARLEELCMFHAQPTALALAEPVELDLNLLTNAEFKQTIQSHRRRFQFWGQIDPFSEQVFRNNLFLMHVAMEVAAESKLPSIAKDLRAILRKFLELRLTSFEDSDAARSALKQVASRMLQVGSDTVDFEGDTAILRRAKELHILSVDNRGRVTFVEQLLQDYLTVFLVNSWDEMPATKLRNDLQDWQNESEPKRRAVNFFLPYSTRDQLNVIVPNCERIASIVLEEYEKLSSSFSEQFSASLEIPLNAVCLLMSGEDDQVGGIGPVLQGRNREVLAVPVGTVPTWDVMGAYDIASMSFRASWNEDQAQQYAQEHFLQQVKSRFEKGLLTGLTLEMKSELVLHNLRARFPKVSSLDPYKQVSIHSLREWRDRVEIEQLYEELKYLEHAEVQTVTDSDDLKITMTSFPRLDKAANLALEAKAKSLFQQGRRADNHGQDSQLYDQISEFGKEESSVEWPVFVGSNGDSPLWRKWSREEIGEMLCRLYRHAINGYRACVEANFPTLREHFPLCDQNFRVFVYVPKEILPGRSRRFLDASPEVQIIFARDSSLELSVELTDVPYHFTESGFQFIPGVEVKSVLRSGCGTFFSSDQIYKGTKREHSPLVHLVHELLWKDLGKYIKSSEFR